MNNVRFYILSLVLLYAVDVDGQNCICENEVFYQVRMVHWNDGMRPPLLEEYIMKDTNNIISLITSESHDKNRFLDSLDIYHAGFVWGCSPRAVLKDSCLGSASEFERMDAYMSLFYKWWKSVEESVDNGVYNDIDSSLRVAVYKIIGRTRKRMEDDVEYKDIVHIESIKPIHITIVKP